MFSKFSRISRRASTLLPAILFLVAAGCATTTDPLGDRSIPTRLEPMLLAPAAASDSTAAKQFFVRGMAMEAGGDFERALENFQKALALVPNQPALLIATAEVHRELDDFDSALPLARRAHEADPDNAVYHQAYADMVLLSGDADAAIDVYTDLTRRHPDDFEALFDLARLQTHAGQLQGALETYERVLNVLGEDVEVRTQMLHIYIRLADSEGIVSTLESMVEAEPYNKSFNRMLAEAYVQNDEPDRALDLLHKTLNLDPDDFGIVLKLATLYRDLGREAEADRLLAEATERAQSVEALLSQANAYYARAGVDEESRSTAEQMLERVLELDPENGDASLMLGSMRFQNGNYAEAAALLQNALQSHHAEMQVWLQASAAHLQAGQASEAADVADEGLILFPGQPDLLRIAAYAYMETYDNARAISRFEELLLVLVEDEPEQTDLHADVLSALAIVHDRQQNVDASDSLYARAIETHPEHALSLNNYAYALAERNHRLSDALGFAQRAVELEPGNASYLDTLGWVYFRLRKFEEAREWIGKSVGTGTASATVHEHYGDVLSELGEHEEARTYWERARELGGDADRLNEKIDQRDQQ